MQSPVLVLNANFEPLNICSSRRAITLILDGKASLVMNGRGEIKTVSCSYQRPSVIRLARMIKRPRPHIRLTKREILRRDNYVCQYCGQHAPYLTLDHIVPRHLGGEHSWENLVTACPACNHRKGGRTLDQAYMILLHPPKEPPSSAVYLFAHHLNQYEEWLPFVQGW